MSEWMDGVLSSLSRFLFLCCLYLYVRLLLPFFIASKRTQAHTLTHTKRTKERETKEQDEKIVHK
jgi:hypothetical protein